MEGVERVWHRRLRWRFRGAWQWPAFMALTLLDGVLLVVLPPYFGAPDNVFPGVLLAGSANLLAIVILAPPLGIWLRRRRPELPRLVASNYAGAALLVALTAVLVTAGVVHRSDVRAEERREHAVAAAMHAYVVEQAPEHRDALATIDAIRLEPGYYRACVPRDEADRFFCLFVSTDQSPPGVTRDTDESPNRDYRPYGGFD